MLPVIERGLATISSALLAAQYAPDVPMSLISATTGFFAFLAALATSSLATALPPGEFMSSSIAFIAGFLSAFSMLLLMCSADAVAPPSSVSSFSEVITPFIFMCAVLPVLNLEEMAVIAENTDRMAIAEIMAAIIHFLLLLFFAGFSMGCFLFMLYKSFTFNI